MLFCSAFVDVSEQRTSGLLVILRKNTSLCSVSLQSRVTTRSLQVFRHLQSLKITSENFPFCSFSHLLFPFPLIKFACHLTCHGLDLRHLDKYG